MYSYCRSKGKKALQQKQESDKLYTIPGMRTIQFTFMFTSSKEIKLSIYWPLVLCHPLLIYYPKFQTQIQVLIKRSSVSVGVNSGFNY